MLRSRFTLLVIAALFALGGPSHADHADEDGFQVIANPGAREATIDRDLLRDIYLRKVVEWDGEGVIPIDLPAKFPERDRFTREVIRKTHTQLQNYWYQQIFSGKGVPPAEAESPAAAIAYVLANRGAIAYIPIGADPRGAKVLRVR